MTLAIVYLLVAMPVLSAISAGLYWYDKRQAQSGGQRIPEATLISVDALGGWPGGWWSQQKFRHKTQKMSFRLKYYVAIAANLLLVFLILSGKLDWSGISQMTEESIR